MLVHAAHAVMLDDELLRHVIPQRRKLHDEVAALAAARAGREIVESGKGKHASEHHHAHANRRDDNGTQS